MKKQEINSGFLISKMEEAAGVETGKYFNEQFKKILSENIENLETLAEEEEEDGEIEAAAENRKLITRLRHELQFDVDYDTFDSLMLQITGGISYDLDIVDEYIYTEEKKAHIKKCANKYMGIIAGFPEIADYEISYSNRSQSIYLVTNLPVTEENIEKFTTDTCYCNTTYDEDYTTETVEIRLSDHDFGGNINYSYWKPCINIVIN